MAKRFEIRGVIAARSLRPEPINVVHVGGLGAAPCAERMRGQKPSARLDPPMPVAASVPSAHRRAHCVEIASALKPMGFAPAAVGQLRTAGNRAYAHGGHELFREQDEHDHDGGEPHDEDEEQRAGFAQATAPTTGLRGSATKCAKKVTRRDHGNGSHQGVRACEVAPRVRNVPRERRESKLSVGPWRAALAALSPGARRASRAAQAVMQRRLGHTREVFYFP